MNQLFISRFFPLLILFISFIAGWAQQTYKSERNADIIEYTSRDGMPTSNISSVAQTPDGYIWLASPQGTVRFDGYEFAYVGQEYGVPDMQAVYHDTVNNRLFFASPEKFIRYSEGRFTVFDSSAGYQMQGPSGQVITFIRADSKGRIWIGSQTPFTDQPFNGALTLFDGQTFTAFDSHSFPLHNAKGFIETPYGELIFTSSGKNTQSGEAAHIALYSKNRFTLLDKSKNISFVNAAIQNNAFDSVVDNNGNTWIAFSGISDFALDSEKRGSGVLMYDGEHFRQFPGLQEYISPMTYVRSVFYHKQLDKVFATLASITTHSFDPSQPEVFEFDNGRWKPTRIFKDIATIRNLKTGERINEFMYNTVFFAKGSKALPSCLILSIEGLVASSKNPAQLFTLEMGKWQKHEAIQGFPLLDLKKGLLVKTTKGIGFYHPEESKMLTHKDGLASVSVGVPNFFVDRNQLIWMSYSYSEIPSYAEIRKIGINVWDGTHLRKFDETDGLSGNITFNFMHDTQNRLWLGTSKGVTQIRAFQNTNKEWVFKLKKIATSRNRPYNATSFIETQRGEIYCWQDFIRPAYGALNSADFYLAKFDGQKFIEIPSPFAEKLQHKKFQLIRLREERNGRLWLEGNFADDLKSLSSVRTEIMLLTKDGWHSPPASWQVPDAQLHFVGELDSGSYYLTAGRFYVFNGQQFINLSDSVTTDADFRILKGASVSGTKTDIQVGNRLYIRLRNRGLVIFDGQKLRFHTPKNGFVATDIHDPIVDLRGNLLFASRVGAVMINEDSYRIFYDDENIAAGGPNAVTIDEQGNFFKYYNGVGLYIDQQKDVEIDLKITSVAVDDRTYFFNFPQQLSYENNSLLFNYSVLNFNNPAKTTFTHILEGYDEEWSKPSPNSFAEYQNLPPGNYKFRVRAKTANGFAVDEAAYNFSISPPWWNTWWAYVLYLLAILLFLYSIRKIELRRQLKNARIRESLLRAESAELQTKAAEAQARAIQAENERKTKELEEARQLQLSMLPKELPQLDNLEIAVHMQTATEVGGDYYDFSYKQDGSLNVALGDATGHGMKAGILVSSMKSIFTTNSPKMSLEDFFSTANSGLKSMGLKRMMMGFSMLHIQDHHFELINAGMPPVFLYEGKTREVRELKEHAVPIGAMNHIHFKALQGKLVPGDVLLLLTDGMPEMLNRNKEMYGYDRIRDRFITVAEKKPAEIISFLKNETASWLDNLDPDDDVTFMVVKIK